MFKQKGIMKQKGFTLLELLVVITLLAILAVGGLVAYDGIGNNAGAAAGAYNTMTLDRAIRQHQAVNNRLPDQWDNLANPLDGAAAGSTVASSTSPNNDQFLALTTREVFGSVNLAAVTPALRDQVFNVINNVWGMEEIQNVYTTAVGVPPGKQHNEGSNVSTAPGVGAVELEFNPADVSFVSILPTAKANAPAAACTFGDQNISTSFNGTGPSAVKAFRQNAIHDDLGANRCNFVLALGFGGDAAASTMRRQVQISSAPIFSSQNVLLDQNYNRLIGLFHFARGGSDPTDIALTSILPRPRLLAVVDPDGGTVDTNVARALNPN